MHKIKNIFPIIYDFENLFNAYKAGIKCKRYRPDVMAYTDKLEENLNYRMNLSGRPTPWGATTYFMFTNRKSA